MFKYLKNIFLIIALCWSSVFAFTNGRAVGTPWTGAQAGDLYVSYNATISGITYSFYNLPSASANVTTVKIYQVNVSANYVPIGSQVTVSYVIENTGPSSINITATNLNFFYLTTGNVQNSYFTVTRLSPAAGTFLLGPSATRNIIFRTLVNTGRPLGRFIVDGVVTGNSLFADKFWSSAKIRSSFVFTGAITPNYLWQAPATLNIPAVAISSPNGAIDRVLSAGQSFWVSCNVQNLGEAAVGGSRVLQLEWPASIVAAPTVTTKSFTIGQPVTFNLTALASSYGSGIVTVSIMNTPAVHPIDLLTGATVNYLYRIVTMSITVQRPAKIDILDVYVPTTQVQAYQSGPVTIDVRVRNLGSANAMINMANADLRFMVGGFNMTSTYIMNMVPSASRFIASNQTITVSYVIGTFGGGTGICTVNVTLNATDLNSGWVTSNGATIAEVATYNVTANGGVNIGQIRVNKDPIGYRGSFEVYVPINRINAGTYSYLVGPKVSDLLIYRTGGPVNNLVGISFNVTAVAPSSLTIPTSDLTQKIITYSVTVLASAVSGDYTINVLPGYPHVTENTTNKDVSDPSGGVPTTTVTYDPISPNLVVITANFTGYPVHVTRPQTNFRVNMLFSETMNVSYVPQMSFVMQSGSAPSYSTGSWYSAGRIFSSAVMTLVTANQGYVTASMTGGARDIAGNTVVPSPNCLRFFVDATAPVGSIVINGGQAVTTNSQVTLRFTLSDNYSATGNMQMYIFGLPTSNVSGNPGITLNAWVTYNQQVSLNLQTTVFGTKNVSVCFRDQAGNVSNIYSDSIYLDTNTIIWLYPTNNAIVSNNIDLRSQTSIHADYVKYYVSVNGTLRLIRSNVAISSSTGIADYLWTTANVFPNTTLNAQLLAVMKKGTVYATANLNNITFDNIRPTVTINAPADWQYAFGQVVVQGVATDNGAITSIARVDVSTDNGTTFFTAVGTNTWTCTINIPSTVPNFTTYNIIARAYDQAGNYRNSNLVRLLKYSGAPTITVAQPSANAYMKNVYTISGNVTSILPLARVRYAVDWPLTPFPLSNAQGTQNWLVTFNINQTLSGYESGTTHIINIIASTLTTPSVVTTYNFPFTIDFVPPTIVSTNLSLLNYVAGTLNIMGGFTDTFSGVSAIQLSVDGGAWTTVNVSGQNSFRYPLAITKPAGAAYNFRLRALDNAWITPNISAIFSKNLTVNYTALPSGSFVSPVSGSYVNNTVLITGTATTNATPGTVQRVFLSFNNGTTWVTANGTTNWNYSWTVPVADPHNTIYHPILKIITTGGIEGLPSPSVTTTYIKDIYGPEVALTSLADGMTVVFDPFVALLATHTDGALVSAAYMVIQGTSYTVTMTATLSSNMMWTFSRDFPDLPAGTYTVYATAVDTAGNWGQSVSINVNNSSGRVITEPLPANGLINGAATDTNPIYATSRNYVILDNITPGNVSAVYIDGVLSTTYVSTGTGLRITLNATPSEKLYVITIFESSGVTATVHYQPVVYDITPPTINVVFSGVTRYYPECIIAPDETFRVNIIDRTATGNNYGSGFSYTPTMSYITGNPVYYRAGTIQRSVYPHLSTTANMTINSSSFSPLTEILQFQGALNSGEHYDMYIYAIDNAGNAVTITFNVLDMIVNEGATGDSGEIDDSKLIISYPNPYDPNNDANKVKITYYLTDNVKKARIYFYNEVAELLAVQEVNESGVNGTQAGYNEVEWDAKDRNDRIISNGVYLYIIVVEGKKQSTGKGKMVILRR